MLSEIHFIGSYFYGVGISPEPQLSTYIPQTLCATFHQQSRIDLCFIEILFFENLLRRK